MVQNVRHLTLTIAIAGLFLQGCARHDSKRAQDKAEKALETVLDAWTRGEPADKYADPNQPVNATDPDWKAGFRLLSFLTLESKPVADGPNHFQCRVSLSLQARNGARTERDVDYDVRLGDKTVIARASH